MKHIYLDCSMGAAGDMLAAALFELLSKTEQEDFLAEINGLGLPGVRIEAAPAIRCGIQGTQFHVWISGEEEVNTIHHPHTPEHLHTRMDEIVEMVNNLPLSLAVRTNILDVYSRIAQAEAHVHGCPVSQIHFHEVGMLDAVADITAVCMLFERLHADQILASPVHTGSGQVHCAHGILPVPAPATAWILREIPVYGSGLRGELCTPTGAALLKQFVHRFEEMPLMKIERIGYGMGKREFPVANCVRSFLGDGSEPEKEECVIELCCNLDDMTPEAIGFAQGILLEQGALDVFTLPAQMKKSRPGVLLTVLCRVAQQQKMTELLFRHTTTSGIRETVCRRHVLSRAAESKETSWGPVRRKISFGYGVRRTKLEYEDVAQIARRQKISFQEAENWIQDEEEG